MNRGTLPILARLHSLQAPARFASGKARVIAEAHDRNPLAQLLRTANETMLGRSLRFESLGGPTLTLDVAGRRVLRMTAAGGLPGAEVCLGVETLEDEHKDDLIKLLQAVALPDHELRVISGPIGRGGEAVSVGLPVALLADLLLVDLNETVADEPTPAAEPGNVADVPADFPDDGIALTGSLLSRLCQRLDSLLLATLMTGGDDDGNSSGPEEMVSHLSGFLAEERDALDRQLDMAGGDPGGPVCIVLGAELSAGHSIFCARANGAMLLGVIEGDATSVILSAWRAALL